MLGVKRIVIAFLLVAGLNVGLAAPAGADGAGDIVGSWVAIDADDSFWEVSFSASGHWNGMDSATGPCEGHRSRTWGELERVEGDQYTFSVDIRCLAGPKKGSEFSFGNIFVLFYDEAANTLVQFTGEEWQDVTFCRRPCDPYRYVDVP